jgi:hypothetical protein
MWSVGGALAYLAGQSCVPKRLSTSQVPDLGGKKRRSPGNADLPAKKKNGAANRPICRLKKKTEPQTGQSAAPKKNRRK